ncbi:MAG TPA: Flp pilus assembly protein CpaB [Pseudomonas sp.]|nr:Flp pilus assembly protein CpaB [Pseudomonas sp.]
MSSVSGKKLLIIAVACGVLAGAMGWLYLKSKEAQYRDAYRPPVEQKVTVVVPKADIGKAQALTPELVATLDVPSDYLASNVVLAEDWPKLEGRMTVAPLQRGRPISWDAVEQERVSRFSENVELGKRIKTVKISKINSFDGMLRPGDRIDLLGSFAAGDIGLQKQPNYADDVVINILEDIIVLAAGREDASGRKYENYYDQSTPDGFNMNFSTLSLMLTPVQVARVELAEKAGEMVAVLRHPKDTSMAELGQVTVANLLDPPPQELIDAVVDADGNLIGRIVGDNIVGADGRIVGKVVDGQAVGFDGNVIGRTVRGLNADDPLLRMHERATVVRDEQGNVIGRVVDGKVIDASGNAIGTVVDGKAVGVDGKSLGRVQANAVLDSQGRVVDMSRSRVQDHAAPQNQERQVVRDATGKVLGRVDGDKIVDAQGQVIGHQRDGKAYDLNGKPLGSISTVVQDAQGKIIGEMGQIARDAEGKIIGRVVDGQLIGADGDVLSVVKDGQVLGQVENIQLDSSGRPVEGNVRVVRDASGKVLGTLVGDDIIDAQGRKVGSVKNGEVRDLAGQVVAGAQVAVQGDAKVVVRDAEGNVIGTLRGDTVFGADGKATGTLLNGKLVDGNGNVLVSGLTVAAEQAANLPSEQSGKARNKRLEPSRMIQFIPGGTGTAGVIPVQTLRLE